MLLMTLMVSAMTWSCSDGDDDDEIIIADQLPSKAKSFINQYFPGYEIVRVVMENDKQITYEVSFRGGGSIEFDANGQWYDVEGDEGIPVPYGFYPESIDTYVSINYHGSYIKQIQRKYFGYEVDLSNDVDLNFDSNGNFLSIDR